MERTISLIFLYCFLIQFLPSPHLQLHASRYLLYFIFKYFSSFDVKFCKHLHIIGKQNTPENDDKIAPDAFVEIQHPPWIEVQLFCYEESLRKTKTIM